MKDSTFKQIQAFTNDFVGLIVVLWSMILITQHGGGWEFVALVGAGLTAIVGKKIGSLMMGNGGMGGSVENDRSENNK